MVPLASSRRDPMAPLVSPPCDPMALPVSPPRDPMEPPASPPRDLAAPTVSPPRDLAVPPLSPPGVRRRLLCPLIGILRLLQLQLLYVEMRSPSFPIDSSSPAFISRSSSPKPTLPVLPGPSIHCTACSLAYTYKRASQSPCWPFVAIHIALTVRTRCTSIKLCALTASASAVSCLGLCLTFVQGPHWPVASILIASRVYAAIPSAVP